MRIEREFPLGDINRVAVFHSRPRLLPGALEDPSQWGNARPYSVCVKCCLALIQKAIESRGLTFLEVCGPRSENGVILPMGY
jgi:hypothetical protein